MRKKIIFLLLAGLSISNCTMDEYSSRLMYSDDNGHFIVINSTRSKDEAIKKADRLISEGYDAEVYLSGNEYFAVVIGRYGLNDAKSIRRYLIYIGLADEDAFLMKGDSFQGKVYPTSQSIMAYRNEIDTDGYFVVIKSTLSKMEAITRATKLIDKGLNASVYLSDNNYFTVVTGPYELDAAKGMKRMLIISDLAEEDAFITKGQSFSSKVYP